MRIERGDNGGPRRFWPGAFWMGAGVVAFALYFLVPPGWAVLSSGGRVRLALDAASLFFIALLLGAGSFLIWSAFPRPPRAGSDAAWEELVGDAQGDEEDDEPLHP